MKQKIEIPFAHLRAFLPEDGKRVVVWRGEEKWPRNKKAFEKRETLEIAFGLGIRAREEDRDSQKGLSPGIRCRPGRLVIRGGWAAHKATSGHPDYFDGTFSASVEARVTNGTVKLKVKDLKLTWNTSLVVKIVDLYNIFRRLIFPFIEKLVEKKLNQAVNKTVKSAIKKFMVRNPGLKPIVRSIALKFGHDTVVIYFEPLKIPTNAALTGVS